MEPIDEAPAVVGLAETLARRWHAGHVDRLGAPYADHPAAVAAMLTGAGAPPAWVAAGWLHDVIEHTDATADDLRAAGVPGEIVRLVETVSRRPGEGYLDFVGRVCADPAAVRVKIADTLHNLDPARDFGPSGEQRARYHQALVLLFQALPMDGT